MAIDRDAVFRSIDRLVERRRYKQAVAKYEKLLRADPSDARLLLKLGDLHTRIGSHALAVEAYARAGRCYAADGFAAKAVAIYKQVQRLIEARAPHLAESYVHVYPTLAQLYEELRLPAEAAAMYDAYAGVLARMGRMAEAATVLRVVVQLLPGNPLTYLRLAEALVEEGEANEAATQFEQAAQLLAGMGRLQEALKVLEHALQQGGSARLARRAAEVYLRRAQSHDGVLALRRLQVAFQAEPENLDTLEMLARAFEFIGQEPRAFAVRKETIRIARKQQAFQVARELARQLLEQAPDDPEVQALARTLPPELPPAAAMDQAIHEVSVDVGEFGPESLDALRVTEPSQAPRRVIVPPELLAAEELSSKAGEAQAAQMARLREQALAFLEQGETAKALYTLRIACQLEPCSVEAGTLLADTLVDHGRQAEAVQQLVQLAQSLSASAHVEQAARVAHRALALEPTHREAQALATSLAAPTPPIAPAASVLPAVPRDVLVAPMDAAPPTAVPPASGRSLSSVRLADLAGDALPARESVLLRGFRGDEGADAALEEAAFFMARGLFEDAISILEERLQRYPNDLGIRTRLEEVGAAQRSAADSAQPSVLGVTAPTQQAAQLTSSIDSITTALTALAESDEAKPEQRDVDDIDIDELFDAFRAGMAAQTAASDSATHYDLGVAYFEMGRLESAASSFNLAAEDPASACVSWSMIAAIHERQGNFGEAVAALATALSHACGNQQQELAVRYEIGRLHHLRGDISEAIVYLAHVVQVDPTFRDAADLLQTLRKNASKAPPRVEGEVGPERGFEELLASPPSSTRDEENG